MAQNSKSVPSRKSSCRRLSAATLKPYARFPLTPHPSGRWCKKIRGKLHYFGKLDSPEAALERFNRDWPFLKEGRTPPPIDVGDGCTIRVLANAFLNSKGAKLDAGELSPRSFADYHRTCALLVDHFGKDRRVDDLRPDDFEKLRSALAKKRNAVTLRNDVNRIRVVLKFAFDQRLIDRPVHFGQSFDRPTALTLRKARQERGARIFEADELRRILDASDVPMKTMILLGANCGFGNSDVATLPQSAVDMKSGWIDYPRPKTAIHRRVPLWPETVEALRMAIADRPKPKDPVDAGLVFLTRRGTRWVRTERKRNADESDRRTFATDPLSQKFAKLLRTLGINGHRNFYTLRHVFETVGGESKDQPAVNAIMGHVDSSMAAIYRERISEERLRAVTETVRGWLWPKGVRQERDGQE